MNCYFCGKECDKRSNHYICNAHPSIVRHWATYGELDLVAFNAKYNGKTYFVEYYIGGYVVIANGFNNIYSSRELSAITPENILKRLPTILTFA